MKRSSYILIGLCILVIVAAETWLDLFLDESSLAAKIWLAITIAIIFLVITFQRQKNSSSKN